MSSFPQRIVPPALGLALAAGALATACASGDERVERDDEAAGWREARAEVGARTSFARGERLYDANCTVCHGARGGGDGRAAHYLFPFARDFTRGQFRLVSTDNGRPTDEDLVRTLRRGIPGSAMPSWAWMSDQDHVDLAGYVRHLAVEGLATELLLEDPGDDAPLTEAEALERATAAMAPGTVIEPFPEALPTEETLARGAEAFETNCASCHLSDGSGSREPRFDEAGELHWARDLTAGFLKGGATRTDLSWRLLAGMPGTSMPRNLIEDPEVGAALVAYVRELVPEGTDARLVHRRRLLLAERVDDLPGTLDDAEWSEGEAHLVLAPLRWRPRSNEPILAAWVSARHDGEHLALRVRWRDPSGDERLFSDLASPDAVALQLSASPVPPLFGMGSDEEPTNIWHWKALRLSEVDGALDLLETVPHGEARPWRGKARLDVPVYHPLASVPPASETVESLQATGVGDVETRHGGDLHVSARPVWNDGQWTVLFVRSLSARAEGEIELEPGRGVSIAVAAWNGSAGDRGGQKSISIWHGLELAR
jgi:mono/diheme cytochrome c family protein